MTGGPLLVLFAGLGLIAWLTARARALAIGGSHRPAALPNQHGAHALLWTLVPALVFLAAWAVVAPALATADVIAEAAATLPPPGFERDAVLAEARALAGGAGFAPFHDGSPALAAPFAAAQGRYRWIGTAIAVALALAGGAFALTRVRTGFRARTGVERAVMLALLLASLIAILATIGIVASLVFESVRFFRIVPVGAFLTGTVWDPGVIAAGDPGATLGAVPLFWGTFFIGAVIAMLVAIPIGLMSAIYLTQYAAPGVRRWMKPALEVLAGVPTVVYGYFAALTVGPAVRRLAAALGMEGATSDSALAAGLVMGVMIVPFVSSMADDALAAVPAPLRDASLAIGATPAETIRRVLLPAALPGIAAGILLAVSRAIGETMIVVMAASGAATISLNPLDSATTVTKQIVDLLTGEAAFDSPRTLAAYALGMTLFAITFLLNIVALATVRRFREAYD